MQRSHSSSLPRQPPAVRLQLLFAGPGTVGMHDSISTLQALKTIGEGFTYKNGSNGVVHKKNLITSLAAQLDQEWNKKAEIL